MREDIVKYAWVTCFTILTLVPTSILFGVEWIKTLIVFIWIGLIFIVVAQIPIKD